MAKGKGKRGIEVEALGGGCLNALVPAIEPTINCVDKVAEKFEKQNDLISVPDTYAKGFPLAPLTKQLIWWPRLV